MQVFGSFTGHFDEGGFKDRLRHRRQPLEDGGLVTRQPLLRQRRHHVVSVDRMTEPTSPTLPAFGLLRQQFTDASLGPKRRSVLAAILN